MQFIFISNCRYTNVCIGSQRYREQSNELYSEQILFQSPLTGTSPTPGGSLLPPANPSSDVTRSKASGKRKRSKVELPTMSIQELQREESAKNLVSVFLII